MKNHQQPKSQQPEDMSNIHNSTGDREKLEADIMEVAYGEANWLKKYRIERLAKKYPEIRKLLTEYRSTAQGVKAIASDQPNCPSSLTEGVYDFIERSDPDERGRSKSIYKKPLFIGVSWVTATAAMLLLMFVFTERQNPINPAEIPYSDGANEQFTAEEVAMATEQAKESLALVSRMLNQTENDLRQNIFKGRISKPMNRGLSLVTDIFQENDRNITSNQ